MWLAALALASSLTPGVPTLEEYEHRLTRHTQYRYAADLEEVKRRGVLRVLTRNNSASYFLNRGAEFGFEYELARAFAKSLGVRIAFVVPDSRGDLIRALLEGEGDLIAAGMSATADRAEFVRFTNTFMEVRRVVATHRHTVKLLDSLKDLPHFKVHLSFGSTTYQDALHAEQKLGKKLDLEPVTDGAEMESMMRRVASGEYEATIVDEALLDLEVAGRLPLSGRIPIGKSKLKAWGVHPDAVDLAAAANDFLAKNKKLTSILRIRYYKPSARGARRARDGAFRADKAGAISPYDSLFKKAGDLTKIDWRLLAAVAYSESRFNPRAKSRFGAQGLMQLLPNTAKRVGITELEKPWWNILAGARYLRRLMDYFAADGVEGRQQIRFALAGYNAGIGHVQDARFLAKLTKKDPNRWFGQVEKAMLLKEDRRYHEKTRHGYSRARETINYVSRIQSRYDVYVQHVPLEPLAPLK